MVDTKKRTTIIILSVLLLLCVGVFAAVNIIAPGTFDTVVASGTNNTILLFSITQEHYMEMSTVV